MEKSSNGQERDAIRIVFEQDKHQALAFDGERQIGECTYYELPDRWTVDHTGVREGYGGRGIARKLVDEVFLHARENGKKIRAICSYAQKVLYEDPQYSDLRP